ncbi:hypothetical protein ACFL5H_02820 [Candidatus Latescibacterota bacterium]
METMGLMGFIFGMSGIAVGGSGISFSLNAIARIDKLEKKLKETGVLDKNFKSD